MMVPSDFESVHELQVEANMEDNTVSIGFLDDFGEVNEFSLTPEETEALAKALWSARYDLARIPREYP